jgi:hypothetical protein
MIADGVYSRVGASRPEVEPADRATCTRRGMPAAFWSDSRAGTRTGTAFAIDRAGRNSLRLSRISVEEAVLLLSAETPADMPGLARKGEITVGADAAWVYGSEAIRTSQTVSGKGVLRSSASVSRAVYRGSK